MSWPTPCRRAASRRRSSAIWPRRRAADRSTSSSTKALSETFVGILDEFRGRYVLGFTPQGSGHGDGWHRLQVRVKGRSVSVKARPGYDAGR